MKHLKTVSLSLCLMAAFAVSAQEVDKATVATQADAAKKAADALKSVDTGEKAWQQFYRSL